MMIVIMKIMIMIIMMIIIVIIIIIIIIMIIIKVMMMITMIMIIIMVMKMMMMMKMMTMTMTMTMITIITNKEKAAVLCGLVNQVCSGFSQVETGGKLTAFNRLTRRNFLWNLTIRLPSRMHEFLLNVK